MLNLVFFILRLGVLIKFSEVRSFDTPVLTAVSTLPSPTRFNLESAFLFQPCVPGELSHHPKALDHEGHILLAQELGSWLCMVVGPQ